MADRYDEDRWRARRPAGWDDHRIDNGEREDGSRPYNRDRSDRSIVARGADEVRSWFGDDDAQQRREDDERRDALQRERDQRSAPGGRGIDPQRAWARDETRTAGIGREWSPFDGQYGWEGGGRTASHPSYDSYERDAANRMHVDRSSYAAVDPDRGRWFERRDAQEAGYGRPFTERGDRDAYDRFQGGYFNSSMGYTSRQGPTGNLNPFRYRGPGAPRHEGYAGRGPRNYQRSDERIREDIVDRLTEDDRVDASDIDVRVQNGEVTLTGQVHDRRMRRAAEVCIEDMPGVRDVHNQLQVAGRGALGQAGAPQERDDVTSLNLTGAQAQEQKTERNR